MSGAADLHFDRYPTSGGDEWMMRIGPAEGAAVMLLPPFFEEMNRCRALLASVMRLLARRGLGCWLPDLPGTGESEQRLETITWKSWQIAADDAAEHVARASGKHPLVASFRGGALLDTVAASANWRFAPAEGASLARDLMRASMLTPDEMKGSRLDLAGYTLSDTLLADLSTARIEQPARLRTVRLETDRGEADLKVQGPALWRRSEPGNSPELAELLALDIMEWGTRCDAF